MDTDTVNINSYGYGYGKYKLGNLILFKKQSKCGVSREVKNLYIEPNDSDKPHRNSVVNVEWHNTISRNSSVEKQSKLFQNKNYLGGEFISNLFLAEKKDGGINQ